MMIAVFGAICTAILAIGGFLNSKILLNEPKALLEGQQALFHELLEGQQEMGKIVERLERIYTARHVSPELAERC